MTTKQRPPQLLFDDGSRVVRESSVASDEPDGGGNNRVVRGSTPLHDFYEIDRLSTEILAMFDSGTVRSNDGWLCRVALQFPDSLLPDSPEVCWAMEEALSSSRPDGPPPLVFVLGDTTFGPCLSLIHI